MIACPVIPRREIPFSPLSDNWMCQTYCVWTWTKYSVERNPKKYFVKSMRIHTNTNAIYQWRWKSWSLRQLVSHYFFDSLVSPCLHFLDKLEDHFDKAGCTLRLSDVGPLRLLYHPLGLRSLQMTFHTSSQDHSKVVLLDSFLSLSHLSFSNCEPWAQIHFHTVLGHSV